LSARGYLIGVGVALALLAGAFSAGRFSAPLKVETRDVERVVTVEKVVEKIVTVEVKAKAETKVVYRDRVVTKEGEIRERIVERTVTKEDEKRTTDADSEKTKDATATTEHVSIVTLRPSWRVGVLIGGSVQRPALDISGPLVLGATFEYRVLGGWWLGLWTLPQHGAIGASLTFEF